MNMKALSSYTGKILTSIARMRTIEHHSSMLLSRGIKVLSSYYLTGIMLTPISQMTMT